MQDPPPSDNGRPARDPQDRSNDRPGMARRRTPDRPQDITHDRAAPQDTGMRGFKDVVADADELGGAAAQANRAARRTYANATALVETRFDPLRLLKRLKNIERHFGRRRGARWSARVLDLDIILWSRGVWATPELTVPHRAFRHRSFVLGPLATIAPRWRDPLTGLSVRQMKARLDRRRPAA